MADSISLAPQPIGTRQLAHAAGVTQRTAQLWLRGQVQPSRRSLGKLRTAGVILVPPRRRRR